MVLGGVCANCNKLEENARAACSELKLSASFSKVKDFAEIAGYGVMQLPALVVDGDVVCEGRVPSVSELKRLLHM